MKYFISETHTFTVTNDANNVIHHKFIFIEYYSSNQKNIFKCFTHFCDDEGVRIT